METKYLPLDTLDGLLQSVEDDADPDIYKCVVYKIKGLMEDAEVDYKKQKTIAVSNFASLLTSILLEWPVDPVVFY